MLEVQVHQQEMASQMLPQVVDSIQLIKQDPQHLLVTDSEDTHQPQLVLEVVVLQHQLEVICQFISLFIQVLRLAQLLKQVHRLPLLLITTRTTGTKLHLRFLLVSLAVKDSVTIANVKQLFTI